MKVKVEIVPRPSGRAASRSVRELVNAVMASEGVGGEVTVAFVDETEMTGLNERFRKESGPTDVLSFGQPDGEGEWPEAVEEQTEDRGEIVVCPAIVERYAQEEDGDPATQLGWAIVHGVLHLLGYDHERDDGEMRARESELLRELDPKVRAVSTAFRG